MSLNRLIGWRAKRIGDPIERLRYLRHEAPIKVKGIRSAQSRGRSKILLAVVAVVAVASASVAISAYTFSKKEPPPPLLVPAPSFATGSVDTFSKVWLVDHNNEFEMYSNGLRIENRYSVANEPRISYPVFARRHVSVDPIEWRTEPAGIVYHTTESNDVPFEADETRKLERVGQNVLEAARQERAYNFVIDRFGRVWHVVQETDIANHSGMSVWGDERVVYVNVNHSFLGVAFETQTRPGEQTSANAAQIHAARVLTEMLRSKYHIPASNCVTHAQVSVNPSNMLVGYHTDWASNFPFSELGLDDNYLEPPASVDTFGFSYDSTFVNATGSRMWQGLILAEEQVRAQAVSQGLPVNQYIKILQRNYKEILATVRASAAPKEKNNAS